MRHGMVIKWPLVPVTPPLAIHVEVRYNVLVTCTRCVSKKLHHEHQLALWPQSRSTMSSVTKPGLHFLFHSVRPPWVFNAIEPSLR